MMERTQNGEGWTLCYEAGGACKELDVKLHFPFLLKTG